LGVQLCIAHSTSVTYGAASHDREGTHTNTHTHTPPGTNLFACSKKLLYTVMKVWHYYVLSM